MMHHEKCSKNEVFIGNFNLKNCLPADFSQFETLRIGDQAFDIYGRKILCYMVPLFIGIGEYTGYCALMDKKLSNIRTGKK